MKTSLKVLMLSAATACVLGVSNADLTVGSGDSSVGYPKPINSYVNDFAGVIKTPDVEEIKRLFDQMRREAKIEAVVVTINSIKDYNTYDDSIESFATGLFNKWGIGGKSTNDGILILVAVKDRKCRIELGSGYGLIYNDVMKRIIDQEMIPSFKAGDFSAGIYKASKAVVDSVTIKVSMMRYYLQAVGIIVAIVVCICVAVSCFKQGKTGWGWALVAVVAGLLIWLFKVIEVILSKLPNDKDSSGGSASFGGGKSSGGGASGSW